MKTLEGLALALALAFTIAVSGGGCKHDTAPASTTPSSTMTSGEMSKTSGEDPMIDPTLPSWAPRTCAAYHAAVVRFVSCESGDAAKRESARQAYDTTNKSWQGMHDLPQGAIEDVKNACARDEAAVHAQTDPACPQTTTKATAAPAS